MVGSHPTLARAMVNLHRRYRLTTAQLAAATEDRYSDGSGTGSITMPHEEVREVEALYTNGPYGGGGATATTREVLAIASTYVPRDRVTCRVSLEVA